MGKHSNFINGKFSKDLAIANAKKHGCNIIEIKHILNVPIPNDFNGEYNWVNSLIKDTCTITVSESRNRKDNYTFGEVGNAITIKDESIMNRLIHGPVYGEYHSVKLINGEMVSKLRSQYQNIVGAIICVHNHPSNGHFSFNDIKNLILYPEIGCIVVIGNTHWLYVLSKTSSDIEHYKKLANYMDNKYVMVKSNKKVDTAKAKNIVASKILDKANIYKLKYNIYRRKQ